jgi:hypothetical protein
MEPTWTQRAPALTVAPDPDGDAGADCKSGEQCDFHAWFHRAPLDSLKWWLFSGSMCQDIPPPQDP